VLRRLYLVLLAGVLAVQCYGQWITQQINLQPGWNSVYLTIQPVPSSCSELFEGLPVEHVSWWSRQTGQAEFDSDPQQTFPRTANWRNWYAADGTASTFGSLLFGESYMVKVEDGAAAFTVYIKGVPRLGTGEWLAGEDAFTGLPVPEDNTLPFGHFFSFTDELNPVGMEDVHKLNANGTYTAVFRPASEAVGHGKAYWIKGGTHNSSYSGPVEVRLRSASGTIDFSESFTFKRLEIENITDADRWVTIRHLDSEEPPPGGGLPAVAGKVPLAVARLDLTGPAPSEQYAPLPDILATNIPAGESIMLKLLPMRNPGGGPGAGEAWQSILQVTDEDNNGEIEATVLHRVGVSWAEEDVDYTGLWVGSVAVTHVNRAQTQAGVSNIWDHTEPVPVVRPYVFRTIIHLDSLGNAHLLQRVLSAWIPDGEIVITGEGIQTNGIHELYTDEQYAGQSLTAHPAARISRISSVNLPLMDPVPLAGIFGGTNVLDCTVELPFDDPVNPFVHRYHPMHDNLEYDNDGSASPLGEGAESSTINRAMQFAFDETDPEHGAGNPRWGVSELGGTFTETVSGLNKTIYVEGQFRLEKISDCGVLKYLDP
jgi:hypothetical protein